MADRPHPDNNKAYPSRLHGRKQLFCPAFDHMDVDNPREVTQEEALQLWNSDAQGVFRSFRDHAITLIEIVARVHYLCGASDRATPVLQLFETMREFYDVCRCTAKNMWWSTPLPSYLTRPRPIVVFVHGTRRTRLDGSCFHEVAINFADSLDGCVQGGISAHEYVAHLRFQTGRGDEVTDYLKSLVADIRCEWRDALERYKQTEDSSTIGKPLTDRRDGLPAEKHIHNGAPLSPVPAKPLPFTGGNMEFLPDRVKLCGVDICSGPRCETRRQLLELLSQQVEGRYVGYSGEEIALSLRLAGGAVAVAGLVRDLRDEIVASLRDQEGIDCDRHAVVLSRDEGYRLSPSVSVRREIPNVQGTAPGSSVPDRVDPSRDDPDDPNRNDPDDPDDPDGPDRDDPDGPDRDDPEDSSGANARQAWILEQLADNRELRAPDVVRQFGCSLTTAKRALRALKRAGRIVFVGDARTGSYRLNKPQGSSE